MGRPRLYAPHKATSLEKREAQRLLQAASVSPETEDYLKFCGLNKDVVSRSALLALYAAQLTGAGLKPSTIKSRLENAKGINPFATDPRDARVAQAILHAASHASAVAPPKKKVTLRMSDLVLPLHPSATTTRDRLYQAFWWVLLATGGRPHNVREADANWCGSKLKVLWHGRKSDTTPCHVAYLLKWGDEGKIRLTDYGHLNDALRNIGTPDNAAACINAWIKQWLGVHHPSYQQHMTSTLPRVRMDAKLRAELQVKHITEAEYEVLMDHTIKTSNSSYAEILDVERKKRRREE